MRSALKATPADLLDAINRLLELGYSPTKIYMGDVEVETYTGSIIKDRRFHPNGEKIPGLKEQIIKEIKAGRTGLVDLEIVYWPRHSMLKFGVKKWPKKVGIDNPFEGLQVSLKRF